METLLEFLESSTIHGLSYISTSKVTYYLMPQLERIVITIYIDIKPAIFRSVVQLHLFAWCVTHHVMLLWMCHWLLIVLFSKSWLCSCQCGWYSLFMLCIFFDRATTDLVLQNPLDFCGHPWFPWSRIADRQVVQGVARVPGGHLDHHPPHQTPGLPHCDHLSSKGLQHCPLPWPCKGRQQDSPRGREAVFRKHCY